MLECEFLRPGICTMAFVWIEMKKYKMNVDFTNIDNLLAIEKQVLEQYKNELIKISF